MLGRLVYNINYYIIRVEGGYFLDRLYIINKRTKLGREVSYSIYLA